MKLEQLNPNGFDTTPEIDVNLGNLLGVLDEMEKAYGTPYEVNSGLRDMADHLRIYAEKNKVLAEQGKPPLHIPMSSKHLSGLAADVKDPERKIWNWCMANLPYMEKLGVYFEAKEATPTWTHMQIVPPGSGHRVFMP